MIIKFIYDAAEEETKDYAVKQKKEGRVTALFYRGMGEKNKNKVILRVVVYSFLLVIVFAVLYVVSNKEHVESLSYAASADKIELQFSKPAEISDEEKDKMINLFYDESFFNAKDREFNNYVPAVKVLDIVDGHFTGKKEKQRAVLFSVTYSFYSQAQQNTVIGIVSSGENPKKIYKTDQFLGWDYNSNSARIKVMKTRWLDSVDSILLYSDNGFWGSGSSYKTVTILKWIDGKLKNVWQHLKHEDPGAGASYRWGKEGIVIESFCGNIAVTGEEEYFEKILQGNTEDRWIKKTISETYKWSVFKKVYVLNKDASSAKVVKTGVMSMDDWREAMHKNIP